MFSVVEHNDTFLCLYLHLFTVYDTAAQRLMSVVFTDAQSAVRCKKKLSSPNFKYYAYISLEKLCYTTKHLLKRAEN